ncbi:MAG: hypothetical protein Q8P22_06785 [Chloroflexota bacterium]|nr:hypothetical protein [Chloroflexota bacterium]
MRIKVGQDVYEVSARTYIYIREDGHLMHVNAAGGFIGQEYEHEDGWEPPADWPYEIKDLRPGREKKAVEEKPALPKGKPTPPRPKQPGVERPKLF